MEWLKWFVGATTDPKFAVIARRSKQNMASVIAVWAMLLERAGQADERGEVEGFDCEGADIVLGLEDGVTCSILQAMQDKGLIANGCITNWDKHRPYPDGRKLDVSSNEWAEIRLCIFQRDNFTCQYCGKCGVRLECDHVFPFSLGGKSTPENLVTACVACNRSKGAKTLSEWRKQ